MSEPDLASPATTLSTLPTSPWALAAAAIEADGGLRSTYQAIVSGVSSNVPPGKVANLVVETANKRKSANENQHWSFNFKDKKVVLRDCFDKVVNAVLKFKDLGSALAGLDHMAGTPWACVIAVLEASRITPVASSYMPTLAPWFD